jgi:succinate dehydrogenase flavin-adding protein (antitoxin of CptAB toxin-antitoxin module)
MLENETLMIGFMEDIASKYTIEEIERLGRLMEAIFDNDLFDLLMGHQTPAQIAKIYSGYDSILEDIGSYAINKGVE